MDHKNKTKFEKKKKEIPDHHRIFQNEMKQNLLNYQFHLDSSL